jgi:D-3-phosphoglycerate dehydrogenase
MSRYKVIITEPINKKGIEYLKEREVEVLELPLGSKEDILLENIEDADGIITRGNVKVTREMMEHSPKLKVVGVHGIGCDHVDLKAAKELGKVVCNTPDALTVTVAEMTVALVLAAARNIVAADRAVRSGQWNRKYSDLIGLELAGKIVGIVGLGRIGVATAKRLKAFNTEVVYYDIIKRPDVEKEIAIRWVDLDDLLVHSDIISLHIPGTDKTHHFIGERELSLMKKDVIIVNIARGRIIDEEALINALKAGKIRSAALDVFEKEPLPEDSPLLFMDNVILTPHLGASNLEGMQRMAVQVAENVYKVIEGYRPDNPVVM